MRASVMILVLVGSALMASAAQSQTHVGKNLEGGMHWAVSAPQGASWTLLCRFPPVTYWESAYEQRRWMNRFEREGRGDQRGRLPLNIGHCHVTKTGGAGPVGVALVRPGEVRADATRDAGRRAAVGFL